ncbi:hypothetical protein HCY45_04315 [Acinetobacter radioresistens]|uniref:hypothetical protein n=1 Tax=Acinetobacter radioresistens TaxID=40216 RepID=UPI002002CB24|nr:hypothetical protein [Acinetobacter radioresistens]MCK4098401.1 hypothetical protein [Acinetobacter radioresistens]
MTKHDNVSLGGIMKATEFIKKFGLNTTENYADHCVNINDLKRIVESHELVERTGGLRECRLMSYRMNVGDRLAQAIADVEACQ